jgi:UDP-N-acetylmuramoyl-L-alanyl-D-glutamate--2,6-diaminopimelate ligase
MKELLSDVAMTPLGDRDATVGGVACRSDAVAPGDAFFAVRGLLHDGHDYAADAVSRGASAIVVEHALSDIAVPQFLVADTRAALARASSRIEGQPSKSLDVVGITGTNGKTTTVYLLDAILRHAGLTTGLIGTVETRVAGERMPSSRTTPDSRDLQHLLAEMRDAGVTTASMEVSSHAIDLHRVDAVEFAAVAFTNLTQDHLDYHHTIEEYAAVKRRLFTDFPSRVKVIDIDDEFGASVAAELPGITTVGRSADAMIRAIDEIPSASGTVFTLVTRSGTARVELPLAGAYNVSNALVAAGCALGIGIDLAVVVEGLNAAPQVPGRLERVEAGQPFSVIVDYAHTPDSLDKALLAVKAVTTGRVIAVFGCGGDRDPAKRPVMGAAAARNADISIITSDNPRTEDPVGIILQVEDGLRDSGARYEVEVDRRRAIARAIELAEPGDAVLIAGKGHEDYQIFAEQTIHFDDREVAREEIGSRC